ncbi:unnamed protein product [Cuscuta campestris]|uniref:Uncharacterized protein n=1 Tax=Cuscuta campestris TaxID=132261 RepID=A0A484M2C0_9ASTE|nr:unnamed protein product [Cuscuta campestris]
MLESQKGTRVHPDLARFLLLFRLAKSSGRSDSDSGSYASIFQRQEKLFKTRKDSAKSWKGEFIFVSLSSGSPFRKEPHSSFRRRTTCVTSDKMLEDVETLCRGGPFKVGSLVTNEALAALGFVFLSPEDTHRIIEGGPLGEIMLSNAERVKLMFQTPRATTLRLLPPRVKLMFPAGEAHVPIMKDFGPPPASRRPSAPGSPSQMGTMIRRPSCDDAMSHRLHVSEEDRGKAYLEITDLNEKLKAAKEQARRAKEQAREMRGETFSLSSYSPGGSSAIPTKSGPSSSPPPSPRDSWDSDSASESVHPDPFAKIPGFIYYSSEEDVKTPSPPAHREATAPLAAPNRGGRGCRPPAPPAEVPSESSVASHHPSRHSLEDPGSPSFGEFTSHSVVNRAPSPPSYPPPCSCKRGWNCGMH